MFFGRTEPGGPQAAKCVQLSHKLHDGLREANGKHAGYCRILTHQFAGVSQKCKEQCIRYSGMCAGELAQVLIPHKIFCTVSGCKNRVVLSGRIDRRDVVLRHQSRARGRREARWRGQG
ncbi:MAG: hypothetical protein ACFNZW_09250 [Coriobacteriaceae bacterium]